MTCREVMTATPKCCLPDDIVARAAEIMREEDVGPVPVVQDLADKRLRGIVTDRDIAIKMVAAGRDPRSTRVEEIMSKNLIACYVDDDYEQAMRAMAQHQVRRIPVVDKDGKLAGIISQADLARESTDIQLGEVVEEISEPAGLGRTFRSMKHRSTDYQEHEGSSAASALLMGAACLSVGAGIMYLLDPDRGRTRRAKVRDKAASLYNDTGYYAGKMQRDLRNRATGAIAGAKARLSHEDEIADQKLEARVRAKLGRVSSHPHAIRVRAANGRVTLEGSVLAEEFKGLLSAVRSISGVHDVENRLHIYESAANVSDLQGDSRQRREFMRGNWSPAARLVAGAVGGGLAVYGLRARAGLARAAAGARRTVGL
jgi:CBS domain-containing protein/osmotically-inducible protein OsmY